MRKGRLIRAWDIHPESEDGEIGIGAVEEEGDDESVARFEYLSLRGEGCIRISNSKEEL